MKITVSLILIALTVAANAPSQATGGATGGGATGGGTASGGATGGGATGGVGSPVRSPSPSLPGTGTSNPNTGLNSTQRPIFLSGKVMMDDGSPIAPNIVIQRVCGGNPRSAAYTDSKGNFSFQWGQPSTFMSDASEAGFGGRSAPASMGAYGVSQGAGGSNPLAGDPYANQLSNCELRAQLAGYRSDSVNLISRNATDNPDVGIIVLHRLANVDGRSISATSYLAPKEAKKAYEKGLQSLLKNKPDEASKEFEKAVLAYPKYADAWLSLGKVRLHEKAFEPARAAMLKAIEADAKLVPPYVELGMMAAQQSKWEEAGPYLDRALRLDPIDFPLAWYADAVANFNLKKYDPAEKAALEARKLDPKHTNPRIEYLLGLVFSEKKNYPAAAEQFRSFLKLAPDAPDFAKVKDQLDQLDKFLAQVNEASKQ